MAEAKSEPVSVDGHVDIHRVGIEYSGYYAVQEPEGELERAPGLLIALHGYGQSCKGFIKNFSGLRAAFSRIFGSLQLAFRRKAASGRNVRFSAIRSLIAPLALGFGLAFGFVFTFDAARRVFFLAFCFFAFLFAMQQLLVHVSSKGGHSNKI